MQARLYIQTRQSPFPRSALVSALEDAGIEIRLCDADPDSPSLILFDCIDVELCDQVRQICAGGLNRVLAIAVAPAQTSEGMWRLLESGASEIICWNASQHPETAIAARLGRWAHVDELAASAPVANLLLGRHPAWIRAVRRLIEHARFSDAPILILGESGTGKELAARLAHTLDARSPKADMVILDCATVVPELSGSEFFGHERGAFTHAVQTREGAIELAHNGTLFLDEIGELPLSLQSQLLRAVQERTYKRVGGNVWRSADFRLVCATHRDLSAEVVQGRFRQDLYYRISTSVVRLPPLRDRRQDIPSLAEHFIRSLRPDATTPYLDATVRDYLMSRDYPGNVRELRQLMTRIMSRHVGTGPVTIGDIPEDDRPAPAETADWRDGHFECAIRRALSSGVKLKDIGRAAEDEAIRIAVLDEAGNLQRAANRLGVTDRALQMRRAHQRIQTSQPHH